MVTRRPRPSARPRGFAAAGSVRLWVDVQPGPLGALYLDAARDLDLEPGVLETLGEQFVFPSLVFSWSIAPESIGKLQPSVDLPRVTRLFGRATSAFLDVELELPDHLCELTALGCEISVPPIQLLGLHPEESERVKAPKGTGAASAVGEGLAPILAPLAGPLAALVRGVGVLFRVLGERAPREQVARVAYQRDAAAFGWYLARASPELLLDGLHRGVALLAVARDAWRGALPELRGTLRVAVDLDRSAENVWIEERFVIPLAPYLAARPSAPSARLRAFRKPEELPLLLTLAEAAALLDLAASAIWTEGEGFTPRFAGRFRWFRGERAPIVERDSFLRFVTGELLSSGG